MAITSPSNRRMAYAPVASTGPFPIDFPVFDGTGADLEVRLNDVVVAGWTFTGTLESGFYGEPNTWINGSISFAAPQTGDLVIYGLREPRRQIVFQEGRGVPAKDLNAELDTLTAVDQELRRDISEVREGLDDLTQAVDDAEAAAIAAAASAAAAALSYDNFDDRYLGDKTVLPALDNDGNALQVGALVFLKDQVDPDDNGLYRWDGTTWLLASSAPQAVEREDYAVVAVDGATTITVTGGYPVGRIKVFLNGSKIRLGASPIVGDPSAPGATASNGTQIVFPAGLLLAGDLIEWIITKPFVVGAMDAADVAFLPAGDIAATNVQAAIEELDTEKAPKNNPIFTGTQTLVEALWAGGSRILEGASKLILRAKSNVLDVRTADDANSIFSADFSQTRPTFKGSALALSSDIVAPGLPRGYLTGFTLSNNVADATNDIDIAAGVARDSTDALTITGTAMTKRLDANWVAGTNQGGLDTGAKANNTWYHLHAICKAAGADPDYLFSTSATAPTLPAAYTSFRRLGAVRTNGSGAILAFLQYGDLFSWGATSLDLSTSTLGTTPLAVTLQVPPIAGIIANVGGFVTHASLLAVVNLRRVGQTNAGGEVARNPTTGQSAAYQAQAPVNASGQIEVVSSQANTSMQVATISYYDRRGRDS